jgi:hypothetical protein
MSDAYSKIIPVPDTNATTTYSPAWRAPKLLGLENLGTPAPLDVLPPEPELELPPVAVGAEVTVP